MSVAEVFSTLKEVPVLTKLQKLLKPQPLDTPDCFSARMEATAAAHPNHPAVIFEGRTVTWRELNEASNRVAAELTARGLAKGDAASLMMENRIEFIICLLAMNKIGVIGALINTNLTGKSLKHCITISNSRLCIFGEERLAAVDEIRGDAEMGDVQGYLYVADSGEQACPEWADNLMEAAAGQDPGNPPHTAQQTIGDTALYIYTSGTTGLPKASVVSNRRLMIVATMGHRAGLRTTPKDRIYLVLPLYHGTGLFFGVLTACSSGATMVLRRKFSASNFLPDIREHGVTCFVYIGELCRYLLNTEQQPGDHKTTLTKVMGNGLRPDIWHDFKGRFGLKRITEFYGASEGNIAFLNLLNKDCTVGTTTMPLALIKYDVDADEVVRGADGRCIPVEHGEPGLLLGQITPDTEFEGYTSKEATEKKILRDVLEEGDAWFNTGDLLKTVDVGFSLGMTHYQFVDRVGDTFRWKSENVSTNEVGEIINTHHQIDFCNVYGVEIPGTDGRAGMVSLVLAQDADALDLDSFSQHVREQMPSYAQPVFLRVQREIDTTGTFKMVKGELRKEGYDLGLVSDPLYVMKPRSEKYVPLDDEYAELIGAGQAGY